MSFSARDPNNTSVMSDFKFACPVCGQHITCDSSSSGSRMDCPTCFRTLIVPQAPAPGSSNFVLAASLAQTRSIPLPGNLKTPAPAVQPKKFPVIPVVIGSVIACGILVAALVHFNNRKPTATDSSDGDPSINSSGSKTAPTNVQPALVLARASADATNWTLVVSEAVIPDAPANGAVNGFGFNFERATIQDGRLDLRQGAKWPPDVGVSIHFLAKRIEDIAGRTVIIEPERTNAPKVILRWKDESGKSKTKEFQTGYAARVEFGAVSGNKISGKVFIATPDDAHSYIAGTFTADVRKPAKPKK